ncbi:MAG: hypothetical protein VX715_01650, partial [Planctomycetota bacterium]|nr:hypothetical protein [Planctomycetota bacterium]
MIRYLLPALLAVMLSIQTGCQPPGGNSGKNTSSSKKQTSQRSTKRSSRPRKRLRLSPDPPKKSIYIPPGISGSNTIILPEVETVMDMIEELSKEAPTMVVWMLDQSASSEALRRNVTTQLRYFYQQPDRESQDSLLTAILGFGAESSWLTEEPTADGALVIEAIDRLEEDNSGREMAFTALQGVLEDCIPYR